MNCEYSEINLNLNAVPNSTNNIQEANNKEKIRPKENSKKFLYEGKAFIDKLNLVDVVLYMKNKM